MVVSGSWKKRALIQILEVVSVPTVRRRVFSTMKGLHEAFKAANSMWPSDFAVSQLRISAHPTNLLPDTS